MSVLVYIDRIGVVAKPVSWEIMGKARELAQELHTPVVGVLIGDQLRGLAEEAIRYGADQVFMAGGTEFAQFRARPYAAALAAAMAATEPSIVLASSNAGVREVMALVAGEQAAGLAVDCQSLAIDSEGRLAADRPVFSGSLLASVAFRGSPQMATVRTRSFPLPQPDTSRTGEILSLPVAVDGHANAEEVLSFEPLQTSELAVENASIIVSGGRGVRGPDGFEPLRRLAKALGGAVGASRAAVDAGWISYPHQIGQTGRSVRPDLYVACGISGAIQHTAGIGSSKVIVAINKDRDAPIFAIAQYGVVGDLFEVVPALTAAFEKRSKR